MKRGGGSAASRSRREGAYVRVPGSPGQESPLAAQEEEEEELRATFTGVAVEAVTGRGCGLRENRPGVDRVLAMAGGGTVTVVRVRPEDRLARSGAGWLRRLSAVYGVTPGVLHPEKPGGRDELLEGFVSLVTSFAGRWYGMRPAEGRERLLAGAGQCTGGDRAA